MNTTLEFFKYLFSDLPLKHNIVICHPDTFTTPSGETKNYYKQRNASSIEEAVQISLDFRQKGKDTFFGIGCYKDNVVKNDKGQPKVARKKEFVKFLPALVLDIDAGEGKPYSDYTVAATATHEALMSLGFKPEHYSLVCSGGGVHTYVKLEDLLEAKAWERLATKFKRAVLSKNLQIDPSKTTDIALVLRPAGTLNFKKSQPRAVDFIHKASETISFEELDKILADYDVNPELKSSYTLPFGETSLNFDNIPDLPESALDIFTDTKAPPPKWQDIKCPQLLALEQDAAVAEPLWYQALGVAAHTSNPREAAIAWSKNYDKFNEVQTIIKMNQYARSTTGPALCSTFTQLNPDLCANCKYKGIVTTPLSAVNEVGERTSVFKDTTTGTQKEFSLPPEYRITSKDEIIRVVDGMEICVSDYPIFITSVARHQDVRNPKTIITLAVKLPSGVSYLELDAGALLSSKDGNGYQIKLIQMGVAMTPKKMKSLGDYLIDAYRFFQQNQRETEMTNVFGWTESEDGFYLGEKLIKSNSIIKVLAANSTAKKLAKDYQPKGNLSNWKTAVQVLGKEGLEHLAFGVLIGLASPLYKFTNLSGMSVNYYSEHTGTGKSTACKVAQSIYGNPEGLTMEKTSSQAGIFARLGTVKNLPVLMDEISDSDGAKASDLLYSITTGKERDRSDVNGDLRDSRTWSLIFMTTSNKSLYDKLDEFTSSAAGQKARLIEVEAAPSNLIDEYGEFINTTIAEHHGVAGIPYLTYLVQAKEQGKLKEIINDAVKRFDGKFNFKFSSNERFIKAAIILAWVAGLIANKLELLPDFNVDRIIQTALDTVNKNRQRIIDAVPDINNIIGDYLAERSKYIIQNHTYDTPTKDSKCWIPDEFKGRMDVIFKIGEYTRDGCQTAIPTSAVVTIPVKSMKDYCRINRIPLSTIEGNLSTMRDYRKSIMSIMSNLPAKETITGAPLNTAVVECYRFTLSVQQMDMLRSTRPTAFILDEPVYDDNNNFAGANK